MGTSIAERYIHRTRFFVASRKPGKSSPKSALLFIKAGPKYGKMTSQQERVSKAGKGCAADMRKAGSVSARREVARTCIRKAFGYTD